MTQQEKRAQSLQRIADRLMEKVEGWVETLDVETVSSQTIRHLCATLKDLKEIQMIRSEAEEEEYRIKLQKLRRDAQEAREEKRLTVTIAGGEDTWKT